MYCAPVGPAVPRRLEGRSRLTVCLATSLVRLQLLVLDAGGEPLQLREEQTACFTEEYYAVVRFQTFSFGDVTLRNVQLPGMSLAKAKRGLSLLDVPWQVFVRIR